MPFLKEKFPHLVSTYKERFGTKSFLSANLPKKALEFNVEPAPKIWDEVERMVYSQPLARGAGSATEPILRGWASAEEPPQLNGF